ncbi:predicted protein [Botrytis cinerea T4]|uniref:Uncharacterized protein n=1 Tax=Botryotinia fuckeliana (strain T4) TaxID=999810 RepID=G2YNU1_BOTF4|nr:predicted protein [Botrytis cinerea T4]
MFLPVEITAQLPWGLQRLLCSRCSPAVRFSWCNPHITSIYHDDNKNKEKAEARYTDIAPSHSRMIVSVSALLE